MTTNSEPRGEPPSPQVAAEGFKLPPGYQVSVLAAEPEIRQPISIAHDFRGRLWVAENYTYAESQIGFARQFNDRIVILADDDQDGRVDRRTVFWDQAKFLTSALPGRGGVFLMCPPQLLFVPDRNGDDVPDGPPEVLLDGFNTTTGNRHTWANGLKWGPDGWLWGRVGISSGAHMGVPGATPEARVEMRGGIWRYHPERRVVEAVCQGTTNPWGMDWNELGEPFFINTVIGHLWHAIPGAHFQRMHGEDVHPHSYVLIPQHADHYHFDTGAGWTKSRAAYDGSSFAAGSDALGGGHAHCGLMIYLGANWPESTRGRLFTINFHGRRLNQERLERVGSGYVGFHEPDFLSVGDPWFRGIDVLYGPEGGVILSDWSDTGECHDHDGVHRSSGRLYRVTYGTPTRVPVADWVRQGPGEWLPRVFSTNEWVARQARQRLADLVAAGAPGGPLQKELKTAFDRAKTASEKLQALWAWRATGGASPEWLLELTSDSHESIRSWAVRLLVDDWPLDDPAGRPTQVAAQRSQAGQSPSRAVVQRLVELAGKDPSGLVRLYVASALQRLSYPDRVRVATALLSRAEDARDPNLPPLIWLGIVPLVEADPSAAIALARDSQLPQVREWIARRMGEGLEQHPEELGRLFAALQESSPAAQGDVLRGLRAALRGWRKAPAPPGWSAFAGRVRASGGDSAGLMQELEVLFGEGRALEEVRRVVLDSQAGPWERRQALKTLLEARPEFLRAVLRTAADDGILRSAALLGLLEVGDPEAAKLTVSRYQWVGLEERPALVGALVARPDSATALVEALASGAIPKADLTPFHARQILGFKNAELSARLTEVWGLAVQPVADKERIKQHFRELARENSPPVDLIQGQQVYQRVCASCHKLYGEGGVVGPDLTGSGRADLDYLLDHVVDPSSLVPADYRLTILTLKDGRVLNGVLKQQTPRTVTLQTQNEVLVLERSEVLEQEQPAQSLMPEGLLESLAPGDARNLLAYLRHPTPVPLRRSDATP